MPAPMLDRLLAAMKLRGIPSRNAAMNIALEFWLKSVEQEKTDEPSKTR
jgi:hypothetical protein